mgnify:CR=1 FL=1
MQEIEKVLGHEEVIKHLQNAAAMDKVSHSYILQERREAAKSCWQNYLL